MAGHPRHPRRPVRKDCGPQVGVRLQHARPPGGAGGHDQRQSEDLLQAWDIARQLVETERGAKMDLVLGGGLDAFLPANQTISQVSRYRPSGWERGCKHGRKDGRDLVGEWKRRHPDGQAVFTREELLHVDLNSTEQLLGLFSHSMMPYDDEREAHDVTPRYLNHSLVITIIQKLGRDDCWWTEAATEGKCCHRISSAH